MTHNMKCRLYEFVESVKWCLKWGTVWLLLWGGFLVSPTHGWVQFFIVYALGAFWHTITKDT